MNDSRQTPPAHRAGVPTGRGDAHDDNVVELRQYTLHPGRRDELIELFEREFIEPQEEAGMHVIGQFRDLDAPDRFVWLRGFASMPARAHALDAFYSGPVWQRHREAANAPMIDSDDVLLLKPVSDGAGVASAARTPRPGGTAPPAAAGAFCIGICQLQATSVAAFLAHFQARIAPLLRKAGAGLMACYVTEGSANTYPRLPVRENDTVLMWLARFPDVPALDRHLDALRRDEEWDAAVAAAQSAGLVQPPQWLRLVPTARSELR